MNLPISAWSFIYCIYALILWLGRSILGRSVAMRLQVEDVAFFDSSGVAGMFSFSLFRSDVSFFSCCYTGCTNGCFALPVEGCSFLSSWGRFPLLRPVGGGPVVSPIWIFIGCFYQFSQTHASSGTAWFWKFAFSVAAPWKVLSET